jgi:DNA-binding beta-propeller fold protein YncE
MERTLGALLVGSLACALACGTGAGSSPDAGAGDARVLEGGARDAAHPNSAGGITPTFTFESGPVRPLALSPDGTRLFVANTPNASLDVFSVSAKGLTPAGSVYVGIDPVAVAARTDTEVWVVNQVSDSVSVVDVGSVPPRVSRTLLVGDEPSDIVFGGPGGTRAFISTAHRGQQRTDPSIAAVPGAGDPKLTTPGIGRADLWVFDATKLGESVGGDPVSIVTVFGDTPRALAVTPDGGTVYVAIFKSGNGTTSTNSLLPCPGFDSPTKSSPCTISGSSIPGAPPGPPTNYAGIPAPAVGVLLDADSSGAFRDVLGRDWTSLTRFTLPDEDVFAIDAQTLAVKTSYRHVGTTLFAMAVNRASGALYVSNTEARNDLRFEGPGTFAGTTLQGHLAEASITVIDGKSVLPRRLNKHIDYGVLPAPPGTAEHSLSMPLGMAVTDDGSTLYVAAFGSSKVGVFPTAALEKDTFDPKTGSKSYVTVTGGGPGGLVLDEASGRLFVTTRFDDGVSVVDLASGKETSHLLLANPEPARIKAGRPFLYDATRSSSNGEASCASCHMFGDDDHLAWDLGNPDGDVVDTPIAVKLGRGAPKTINGTGKTHDLHPMKGPMTTQTLRGTVNHGPMHWRGDRAVGFFGTDPDTGPPFDSELAFKNFIVAFNSLLGLGPPFPDADMQTFADFGLDIVMPPNPVRALDGTLTAAQAAGQSYFLGCDGLESLLGSPATCKPGLLSVEGHFADGVPSLKGGVGGFTCEGCHRLDPAEGFFGTNGESSFESLPQTFKVPQLRNLYDKIGMFGVPLHPGMNPGNNDPQGPQVRGFGFEHDGSIDTIFRFLQGEVFNPKHHGLVGFANGDTQRRAVEQFLLAFDSDLAPIVGQQVTLRSDNAPAVGPRIDLLMDRATTPFVSKILGRGVTECSLVARVVASGVATSYRLQPDRSFQSPSGASISDAKLRSLAMITGQEVTYTCLPPGW